MIEQLLVDTGPGPVYPQLTGVFTQKKSGLARFSHTFEVIGDYGYAFGGATPALTNAFQRYNFNNDTWETISAPTPPSARYGCASAVLNGKLYLFGGYTGSATNTCYVFDTSTMTWSSIANMPTVMYYGTAVAIGGFIYIYGGFNGTNQLATVYRYDPVANSFTLMQTAGGGVSNRHAHSASVIGGEMHIVDGVRINTILADHHAYNPVTNSWRTVSTPPFGRTYFAMTTIGNRLYAFGGSQNNTAAVNSFYEYASNTSTWTLLPTEPTAKYALKMVHWGGKAWLYGGLPNGSNNAPVGELWMIE